MQYQSRRTLWQNPKPKFLIRITFRVLVFGRGSPQAYIAMAPCRFKPRGSGSLSGDQNLGFRVAFVYVIFPRLGTVSTWGSRFIFSFLVFALGALDV